MCHKCQIGKLYCVRVLRKYINYYKFVAAQRVEFRQNTSLIAILRYISPSLCSWPPLVLFLRIYDSYQFKKASSCIIDLFFKRQIAKLA